MTEFKGKYGRPSDFATRRDVDRESDARVKMNDFHNRKRTAIAERVRALEARIVDLEESGKKRKG